MHDTNNIHYAEEPFTNNSSLDTHSDTYTIHTHTQTDRHKEREDEKSEKETWLNYFK